MRCVRAASRMDGAKKEGIGIRDEPFVLGAQRRRPFDGLRRVRDMFETARMNVLGTVAVRLVDREQDTIVAYVAEDAVDPHPATGGELDGEQSDRLVRGEAMQWIAGARDGVNAQFLIARFEESG